MFRPHDVADLLCCRRDPSLLICVRQVPGSYTPPDSLVLCLGSSRCKDFSSLEQGEVWGEAAVRNWVLSSVR